MGRRERGQGRRGRHRGDVVDDVGAAGERRLGHGRLARVDADGHAREARADGAESVADTLDLLGLADGLVARARRLAAHVEDVGALRHHALGLGDAPRSTAAPVPAKRGRRR